MSINFSLICERGSGTGKKASHLALHRGLSVSLNASSQFLWQI
ncbi:hypothetical protein [Wolbachia endosymbiont (group B) of Endotricha flammealis]|nr:hypothetical protein [Wolbachia endosymbiont (group B) of Endotricha flammealis]